MDEELAVAFGPGKRESTTPTAVHPTRGRIDDLAQHAPVDLRVADDASFPDLVLARLELRLDEHERIPPWLQERQHRRESESHADEGDVADE